jgi:hypothetical protein
MKGIHNWVIQDIISFTHTVTVLFGVDKKFEHVSQLCKVRHGKIFSRGLKQVQSHEGVL